MKTICTIALSLALVGAAGAQNQTTFRNERGQTTGTATKQQRQDDVSRWDGRPTGTATTNSNGTTTFRDGMGRTTGTATRRWAPLRDHQQ